MKVRTVKVYEEGELVLLRNKALWQLLKEMGNQSYQSKFQQLSYALSEKTRLKRRFIEMML